MELMKAIFNVRARLRVGPETQDEMDNIEEVGDLEILSNAEGSDQVSASKILKKDT